MNNMDRVFLLLAMLLLGAGYIQAQLQETTRPSPSATLQAPHNLGRQVALQGGFSLIRNVPAAEQTTAGKAKVNPSQAQPVPQQNPYTF